MSPITHFFTGWAVANAGGLNARERLAVTIAGAAPDLDGLGLIAELLTRHSARPLLWWTEYHHVFGHNLLFALVAAGGCWAATGQRWRTAALALLSVHLHLLGDLVGARGPDGDSWPIPYLWPLPGAGQWAWAGQWALNAWPNFVLTFILIAFALFVAGRRGVTPLELLWPRAHRALVDTIQRRLGRFTP